MKIIQTTGGWIAGEENEEYYWRTIIHKESETIKHICKESNKIINVCTLTLEKEKFSFTFWDNYSLKKKVDSQETPVLE